MPVEIRDRPAFALAVVTLTPNEAVQVEPGAMVSFSAGVTAETEVAGGFFKGFKRMFDGEGLVCELTGPGRVLMQTRSERELVNWLIPLLPSTSST